ncbi:MAG: TIGR00341 family protein [Chloracidobacterium sp.]|nr:TIGR00341 family protein [Chloracidobacterium sp.]
MENILKHFRLNGEKEDPETVIQNIDSGVEFTGTNLWILVFAIFIASLGLNVNSTAVVIGAMLVSPLMGPIMGLGMGMAINDLALLRKSLYNYAFALIVGLTTSTIYFTMSPLRDASSEILSRTSPNIYDVLIALFGGFAGILAVSSKKKANVIPGVAIATALMPPLCTAGYGIANWNFTYFSGAIYLFVINTVFIALATLVTARFLKFPSKHLSDEHDEVVSKRVVWVVVIITILPSIYFGYDIVQQNRFRQQANKFIDSEAIFPNDYLLKKNIDAKAKTIQLTYGGDLISEAEIDALKRKLPPYGLENIKLEIQQGFAYLRDSESNNDTKQDTEAKKLSAALSERETQLQELKKRVDTIDGQRALSDQVFAELKIQYPQVSSAVIQPAATHDETGSQNVWIAAVRSKQPIIDADRKKIEDWIKVRVKTETVLTSFQNDVSTKVTQPKEK